MNLKGLFTPFALFLRSENVTSHHFNSKNNSEVVLCKTISRHRNCFFSSVVTDDKDGLGLKLENVGPAFSSLNALPTKITKKILWLLLPNKICFISFS